MKALRLLVLMFLASLAAAACSSPGATETATADLTATLSAPTSTLEPTTTLETAETPVPENVLVGTDWTLASINVAGENMPAVGETPPTLTFEEAGQAGGIGGCNTYSAGYEVSGDTISFSEIVSTLRACADEALTAQEAMFFGALETADSFSMTADTLTIFYDNGQSSLNFVPMDIETVGSVFPP